MSAHTMQTGRELTAERSPWTWVLLAIVGAGLAMVVAGVLTFVILDRTIGVFKYLAGRE